MHVREHGSLTAAVEKRLLVWIARRLPPSISPDRLTATGLAAMAIAAAGFAALNVTRAAAAIVVVALWHQLARRQPRWHRRSRPRLPTAALRLLRRSCRRRRGHDDADGRPRGLGMHASDPRAGHADRVPARCPFRLNRTWPRTPLAFSIILFAGFGPTELRIVLAIGAVVVSHDPPWISTGPLAGQRVFDVGGAVAIVGLALVFTTRAVQHARLLAAQERATARSTEHAA